jgi:NADPH-dependent 7-cyano-7-deazaguanine reductase QueF
MTVQCTATLFKHYGNVNIKKCIPVKVYKLKQTLKRRVAFRKHLIYHPTKAVDIPTFISILVIFLYKATAALWIKAQAS